MAGAINSIQPYFEKGKSLKDLKLHPEMNNILSDCD
jgi:hypothetical protein